MADLLNALNSLLEDDDFSEDDDALLLLLLLRRRRRRLRAANRKICTKQWLLRRKTHCVCDNLFRELAVEDPEQFHQYHGLDRHSFEDI